MVFFERIHNLCAAEFERPAIMATEQRGNGIAGRGGETKRAQNRNWKLTLKMEKVISRKGNEMREGKRCENRRDRMIMRKQISRCKEQKEE